MKKGDHKGRPYNFEDDAANRVRLPRSPKSGSLDDSYRLPADGGWKPPRLVAMTQNMKGDHKGRPYNFWDDAAHLR